LLYLFGWFGWLWVNWFFWLFEVLFDFGICVTLVFECFADW